MKKLYLFILFALPFIISCDNRSSIEGLWVVESVTVGDQEMTPNARWMRFHTDSTQVSGNGWFQHSVGTWEMDPETGELSMENSNGLTDHNEPFKVNITSDSTIWTRMEEGRNIQVSLKRTNQLPQTYGDKLLGLWRLKEVKGSGPYFDPTLESTNQTLFLRWDRRFVIDSEKGRITGVYNVHGHKPELELIPNGESYQRDFWKIDFAEDEIILSLLTSDSDVTRSFSRIHQFPN